MKKKTLPIVASAALVLSLAACAPNGSDPADTPSGGDSTAKVDFPTETITIVVPYGPGGATDRTSRIMQEGLTSYFDGEVDVVVENREGGGSVVGLTSLWNAEPDGYTIGVTMVTGTATKPVTQDVEYDWDKFSPVAMLTQSSQVFAVAADAPYDTVDEWIEWVRQNPGEFKYGHSGIGSIGNLAMELVASKLDLDIVGIPYSGGGESKQALFSGEVGGDVESTTDYDPDRNRFLLNLASELPGTEGIPTLKDVGIDATIAPWIAMLAPPETPADRRQILEDAFKELLSDPAIKEKLAELQLDPYFQTGEELSETLASNYEMIEGLAGNLE